MGVLNMDNVGCFGRDEGLVTVLQYEGAWGLSHCRGADGDVDLKWIELVCSALQLPTVLTDNTLTTECRVKQDKQDQPGNESKFSRRWVHALCDQEKLRSDLCGQ